MALEGDIVASLTLNHSQFDRGLKQSAALAGKFGGTMGGLTGVLNRHKSTLTQVSFAADDFFGVLGTSGNVAAAVRATSNNIGTLVTAINPLAGVATTLALALGASLIPKLFGTGKAAKDASENTDKLSKSIKNMIGSSSKAAAKMDEGLRIAELVDKDAIDKEIMDINRQLKAAGDEYRSLFLERKAIEQIPGRGTNADLDAIRKRQTELESMSKELIKKRDALNNQALEAVKKQADDEAKAWADRTEKAMDDQFKRDKELKDRREELNKELSRSFELSGMSDEFERRLQSIRNQFADTMDQIKKEFDGADEQRLLAGAEGALQAELTRAVDDENERRLQKAAAESRRQSGRDANPDAAQRGTAQAYSAILKAMRGDAERKHLRAIEIATKQSADALKAKSKEKPIVLSTVESF